MTVQYSLQQWPIGAPDSASGPYFIATCLSSDTKPAPGQAESLIYETDTGIMYGPSGSTWRPIAGPTGMADTYLVADKNQSGLTSTTVLTNHPSLFAVLATGVDYDFSYKILFQSAATTIGLTLGLTFPGAHYVGATAIIPAAADGTGGTFEGWITSSGDKVIATGTEAANTTYCATIEGAINTSVAGTLHLAYAAELVTTAAVTIMRGSQGIIRRMKPA